MQLSCPWLQTLFGLYEPQVTITQAKNEQLLMMCKKLVSVLEAAAARGGKPYEQYCPYFGENYLRLSFFVEKRFVFEAKKAV